ncbi:MAG: type II toxin-antitoxin system RelE/ParE family toxin [Fimbriimonadaceae bacterium]|nr:type II toxin-antitoxin system RelE/ParE family toxin [Fimbriimonadaceae bacterium]
MTATKFSRQAKGDLATASRYYNEVGDGLGDAFLAEVERTVELLSAQPALWPHALRGMRRAPTRRFPYAVYYQLRPAGPYIVAVLHTSRDQSQALRDR